MKFRFYIAWMAGSDGAEGCKDTGINDISDLVPEHEKGNENVTTWDFECEHWSDAELLGYKRAFSANFTARDTFSTVKEI